MKKILDTKIVNVFLFFNELERGIKSKDQYLLFNYVEMQTWVSRSDLHLKLNSDLFTLTLKKKLKCCYFLKVFDTFVHAVKRIF